MLAPTCPSNRSLEEKEESRSFLFVSVVREPLGAESMAPSRLNCCRPSVLAVAMDMASVTAPDMDLRISSTNVVPYCPYSHFVET